MAALVPFAYLKPEPLDDSIEQAIEIARSQLMPAGEAAGLKGIGFAVRLMGVARPDEDVLAGYAAILGELPWDLLGRAIRGGVANQAWHKLPTPGAFLIIVKDELETRRERLSLLLRHRDRVRLVENTRPRRQDRQLEAAAFRVPPFRLRRIDET